MSNRILVVAAHPDDEVLGCGGTIIKESQKGSIIHVLILAEGITSRDEHRDTLFRKSELFNLHSRTIEVARYMGVQSVELLDFPDNRMDSVDLLDVVKCIEEKIKVFQPSIIITHHDGDVNIDHKIVHRAVMTATRPMPGQAVKKILFFETMSSTEWQENKEKFAFLPNYYVDIESTIENKIQALKYYDSEMREYPHSRSYEAIKILAQYRGITVGKKFVEAFAIGRIIE